MKKEATFILILFLISFSIFLYLMNKSVNQEKEEQVLAEKEKLHKEVLKTIEENKRTIKYFKDKFESNQAIVCENEISGLFDKNVTKANGYKIKVENENEILFDMKFIKNNHFFSYEQCN